MVSGRRKMLAARDDLADSLGKIAGKRGFTLFSMVNDLLELAIKADSMGISLKETVNAYTLAKEVRDASFTLVLESLLYDTAGLAYEKANAKAMQTWFDAGVWIGKRYVARGSKDPLSEYERELTVFSWNIPSISMERSNRNVSIRILSPRFPEPYTVLFSRYLEGVLTGCGYELSFSEVGKGNIRLEAAKRGVDGSK